MEINEILSTHTVRIGFKRLRIWLTLTNIMIERPSLIEYDSLRRKIIETPYFIIRKRKEEQWS